MFKNSQSHKKIRKSHRKTYKNLALIIELSSMPNYDHISHWTSSNIPNLLSYCQT